MRRFMTYLIALVLTAPLASAEFSRVGSAGAQFLKIGVGSRYQGMGEASVATANDVYAAYWNPAGLTEIDGSQLSFTNVNYLLDISLNYVGYARYYENLGTFGVSLSLLSMDDQEITTFEQQGGTGEYYSASSYAFGVTYARQLTTRFAFGATVKYIGEKIHNESADGIGFDLGVLLYAGYRSLRLGLAITNMGPEMQFSGSDLIVQYDEQEGEGANSPIGAELKTTPYDLPLAFRFGVAYDVELGRKSVVTVAGDVMHPNDNTQQGALGAEFAYDEKYFLRGGYKVNYEEQGLSFGGGFSTPVSKHTDLLFDYAWQDFGRLQSTHRFSIGFAF